ncbi:MAG: hypothetical protein ACR652_18510 [Methylocystis sp.]|uniref:hypothetical protein n=1 Tax=Methylocystis sp. TaxID=1911079 RepID=UPI003DA1D721
MIAKFSKKTGGVYPINVFKQFPKDALDIPDDLYADFKSAKIEGFDVSDGKVVAKVSEPQKTSDPAQTQIDELEFSITPRRLREAVLTESGAKWLSEVDAKIQALRAKLG